MGFGGGLLVGVFGVGAVRGPPLLLYAQGQLSFFAHVCAVCASQKQTGAKKIKKNDLWGSGRRVARRVAGGAGRVTVALENHIGNHMN